jgi:tRNA G18 (ribose-2'-O)-methylase SpoU
MISSLYNISSLDLPELEPYRTLKQPIEHLQKGIFVAEGEKVVRRLFESTIRVYSILLSDEWFKILKHDLETHRDLIDVFVGEKKLIDTIVGHRLHQAIMAIGQVPKPLGIYELCEKIKQKKAYLIVILDGIANAENMGVIIRNCACFSVDAVIIIPSSCDPYLRRSVRNSMGNIFQLPIIHLSNLKDEIGKLKQCGVTVYAAHPHSASKDLGVTTFSHKLSIIFGSEGNGISKEVLELCDEYITIPMKAGVDSLNVASSSAVVLYELHKRKEVST